MCARAGPGGEVLAAVTQRVPDAGLGLVTHGANSAKTDTKGHRHGDLSTGLYPLSSLSLLLFGSSSLSLCVSVRLSQMRVDKVQVGQLARGYTEKGRGH